MKFKYIFILTNVFVFKIFAQDPLFTNTQQSLIYLNPSFAGSNGNIRYQSVFRNQWPNLSAPYVTLYNSFDMYIKPLRGGIGLSWCNDNQASGTLVTDRVDLTYAQHFSFMDNKLKIIPSLQVTYMSLSLDKTKLNFGDPINNRYNFIWTNPTSVPSSNKKNVDFSSGLLINYKHFYFGTSVFHITQPDIGLFGSSRLPARLSMFASYNLPINEKTLIHFLYGFQTQQKYRYSYINVTALLYKHLIIGCGYKSSSNLSASAGYRNNFFTLTYNYDLFVSKFLGNTAASHEFTASYNLRNKEQRKLITDFERW